MRRRNKLPESLELLLDTMCNTFGAIMFIAISLVIISQVTTKLIREMQPQQITEEYLEQMREKLKNLQAEVEAEEREMAERALAAIGMPKDKREKVEELLAKKSENRRLILQLSDQQKEKETIAQERDKQSEEIDDMKKDIHQIAMETTLKERTIAQILMMNKNKTDELNQKIASAEAANSVLKKQKDNMPKQMLTFSMEVETGSERQYTICLKNGRLYREQVGEIEAVHDTDRTGHFSFKTSGNVISGNANVALNRLIGGVGRDSFVTIFSDQASYDTLVVLRKYLRSRRLKVNFYYTNNFEIGFGGNSKASY